MDSSPPLGKAVLKNESRLATSRLAPGVGEGPFGAQKKAATLPSFAEFIGLPRHFAIAWLTLQSLRPLVGREQRNRFHATLEASSLGPAPPAWLWGWDLSAAPCKRFLLLDVLH